MTVHVADPVAVEAHRRALQNITNEAAITLTRTSGSPVIYEVQDFATSLLDAEGEHLSLSVTVLFHSGSSLLGTRAVIDSARTTDIRPGDGWIVNDPFEGGAMHQGDVGIITPQFYEGELVGWAFSNVHILDVGGSGVSGFAPGAMSVFEEGVRFPPTRIIRDGGIMPDWERFISANVRIAPLVLNDIRSMIAANNVSQKKLTETIDRFGLERFREYCEINKSLTEAAFRSRIAALADGVYETVEWVEFDGHGDALLLEVRCSMEIAGSDLLFTLTGAPQVDAFLNGTPGVVYGSVMTAILTTLAYGDLPFNAGMWRPVSIDVGEPGTIVNALAPAPVSSGHAVLGNRVIKATKDMLNQAYALSDDPVLRRRVAGQGWGSAGLSPLAGRGHGGKPTVMFSMDQVAGVGGGAQTGFDGQDGYGPPVAVGLGLPSVETTESLQPALYLWRRLQQNSGGPGTTRGGQSLESTYAMYETDRLTGGVTIGCTEVPARGAGGGLPASAGDWSSYHATNFVRLIEDGRQPVESNLEGERRQQPSNLGRLILTTGDIMRMHGGGGGGVGDPLLRDPALVAADRRDGFICDQHAAVAYGVVCDEGGNVDVPATRSLRAEIRRHRIGRKPSKEQAEPETPGISVTLDRADSGAWWSCGYCGERLGALEDNWRESAVSHEQPIVERYAELGMQVRIRRNPPQVMIAEHHCRACAGLLDADVYPEGFEGFSAPRLA